MINFKSQIFFSISCIVIFLLLNVQFLSSQNLDNLQWSGSASNTFQAEHILEVSNGNFLVCGSNDSNASIAEGCLILIDGEGNEIIRRILPNISSATHAVENNGYFYVVGNENLGNGWIYQLSLTTLQDVNSKSFFDCIDLCPNQLIGKNALLVSGGGIIVGGYYSIDTQPLGAIVRKYSGNLIIDDNWSDLMLNVELNDTWGRSVIDIERMSDDDILILGQIEELPNIDCNCGGGEIPEIDLDFWGLRITSSGQVESSQQFGSRGSDYFRDAVASPSNGFVLIGYSCDDINPNNCSDNRPAPPAIGNNYFWEFNSGFNPQNDAELVINAGQVIPYVGNYIQYNSSNNTYFVAGFILGFGSSNFGHTAIIQQINTQLTPLNQALRECEFSDYNCCVISNDCVVAVGQCDDMWSQSTSLQDRKIWDAYGDCDEINTDTDCEWDIELECGVTFEGNTLEWNNSLNLSDYGACANNNFSFDGNDVIFKFEKPDSFGNLAVTLRHDSGSGNFPQNLTMFLLDACDGDVVSCLIQGTNYLQGNGEIRGEFIIDVDPPLEAGDYFLVVEGSTPDTGGPFSITVTCEDLICDSAEPIECGQTLNNQSNATGPNNVSSYGCSLTGQVNWFGTIGNERYYSFTIDSDQFVTISLTNINSQDDFELILTDVCDINSNMENCLYTSTNGPGENEIISELLSQGTYYIIVDAWFEQAGFGPTVGTFDISLSACETECNPQAGVLDCNDIKELIPDQEVNCTCGYSLENTRTNDVTSYCGDNGPYCMDEIIYSFNLEAGKNYFFSVVHYQRLFMFNACDLNNCIASSIIDSQGEQHFIEYGSCENQTIYLVVDGDPAESLGNDCACIRVIDLGELEGCNDFCDLFPPTSDNDYNLTLANPNNFEIRAITFDYPFSAMDTGDFTFQDSVATNSFTNFEYYCPEPGCYYVCAWYFDASNNYTSCCFKYCVEAPRYDCQYPQLVFNTENTATQTETHRILCYDTGDATIFNSIVSDSTRVSINGLDINPNVDGEYYYEFPYGSYEICCWTYDGLCDSWNICCKDVCIPYIPEDEKCDANFGIEKEIDPNNPYRYIVTIPLGGGGSVCMVTSVTPQATVTSLGNCQHEILFPGDGVYEVCYRNADNFGYCCEYICIDSAQLTCEESFNIIPVFPDKVRLECNEPGNFRKWCATRCLITDPCDGFSTDVLGCRYNPTTEFCLEEGYEYFFTKERKECCEEGACETCIIYDGLNCNRYRPHYTSQANSTDINYEFNYTDSEDLTLESYTILDENFNVLQSNAATGNDISVNFSSIPGFIPDRNYIICYLSRDASGCLHICYEKYRIYNPFTCSYIQPYFLGTPNNASTDYNFELSSAATGLQVEGWTIYSDVGQVVQAGFGQDQSISWASPDGGVYWICVYLYDPFFDCYQVCYYKFNTWYPYNCGFIDAAFTGDESQNSYQFTLSEQGQQQGLQVIEWTELDETGQNIIQTSATPINQVFVPGVTRIICALVYDPLTRCYSICYYKIQLNNPWDSCSAFGPMYNEATGQMNINSNGNFDNSYVTIDGVNYGDAPIIDFPIPATDTVILCFYYYDGFCWRVCCKEVCVRNCTDCYDDCCPAGNDFTWLEEFINTMSLDCSSPDITPGSIYVDEFNGQCSYVIWEARPSMLFQNTLNYYDCQGNLLDIFSSNVASDIQDLVSSLQVVWDCGNGEREKCNPFPPSPPIGDPCVDFDGDCEDFNNYNITGTCELIEIGGDNVLEVTTFGPNLEDCEETITFSMLPSGEISVLSFDIYIQNGAIIYGDTESGGSFELSFQPNGDVIVSYAGVSGVLISYTKNKWFNVTLELDKSGMVTGVIDGTSVATQFLAVEHLTNLTFYSALSTEPEAYYIDNVCYGSCEDENPIPPSPPTDDPCLDFVGDCEDFNDYNITGTCELVEIVGDNVLEVTTFGPNLEDCEETFLMMPPSSDKSILSFDIYVQNGAIMYGMTETGKFVDLAFQPNGDVNFNYDGTSYNAITTYNKNRWFNVVLELDKTGVITGKIDGVVVLNQMVVAAEHLTQWTFSSALSTAPEAYYVDNFCRGYCDDCLPPAPGGPYNYNCDVFEIVRITPLANSELNITFLAGGLDVQKLEVVDSLSGVLVHENSDITSNASFGWSSFIPDVTYIICIYYFDADGCLRRCCLKINIPFECELISPYFSGDENNLDFTLGANVEGINYEVVSWWSDGQNISNDEEASITFQNPGTYEVCCLLYNPQTRCYILCCRTICVENPLDCNSIQVDYDITTEEYILTVQGVQEVLSWDIDIPTNLPNNGYIGSDNPQRFNPLDFNIPLGTEITISVRYIDENGCLRICCKRLCPPVDPTAVCDFISPVYLGNGLEFYFSAEGTTDISDVTWRLHIPGSDEVVDIGNGLRSDDLDFEELESLYPSILLDKVCISISYKDDVTGCYKICCKCFCIESSPLTCDDISAKFIFENSTDYKYGFELDVANISDIQWTLDNTNTDLGIEPSIEVDFQTFGFGAGDRVYISVRYYDTNTNCYKVCCKVICLEEAVTDCNLINFEEQDNGIYALNFTGNSSQVIWTIDGVDGCQMGEEATFDINQINGSKVKICVLYLDASGCCRLCCIEIDTDCSLDLDLGEDMVVCDGSTRSLVYVPNGTETSIEWYLDGVLIQSNTNVLLANVSGEYSLSVVDNAGCMGSDTIIIEYNEVLNCSPISYDLDTTNPSLVTLNHNISNGVLYEWDFGDGETSTDPSMSLTHEYQSASVYTACLSVTDACDVICTQCITISTSVLTLDAIVTDGGCGANPDFGSIDLFISGGQPPYEIEWSSGQVDVDPLSNLEPGIYSVTVTDSTGEVISSDYEVNVFESLICRPLTYTISSTDDNLVIFNNQITNGVVYEWDFGDGNTSSSGDEEIEHEYLESGIFTACLTVQDACGDLCVQCATIAIDIDDLLIESNVINGGCTDGPLGSIELSVSGGSTPYTYDWDNGSEESMIQDLEAGSYTVTVTDNAGNSVEQIFTIQIFENINCSPVFAEADANDPTLITFTHGIVNGTSYEWDFGDNNVIQDSNQTITYQYEDAPGIYTVCLTISNDCGNICVQCVTVAIQTFYIDAQVIDVSCDSLGAINLNVTGGIEPYTYLWDSGLTSSNLSDLSGGEYSVTVIDDSGSEVIRSFEIDDNMGSLIAQGDSTISVELDELVELEVEGASSALWMSADFDLECEDCLASSFIADGVGEVMVEVIDDNGCAKTIIFSIIIDDSLLFGPNMITPNGDGYNDALEFKGIEQYPVNRLTIFSRWGEIILEVEGYENNWMAQKNSKALPDGVYYYVLEYGVESNLEFVLKRDLLIMRER